MDTDKPRKMKVNKGTRPGTEVDAHGDPIPLAERTAEHRAQALGDAAVRSRANEKSDDAA
jgi:hypothetical protein